jgi:hypothetical protein
VDTRLKKETVDRIVEGATLAQATGQHIIILFEGRTAAGKGGAIKCFTEHLNPRGARVVALKKSRTTMKWGQWYFPRYIEYLPTLGKLVFFDRNWCNRAGIERVMDVCSSAESRNSCAKRPDSSVCSSAAASVATNPGPRSAAKSSCCGSKPDAAPRSSIGNARRSICNRWTNGRNTPKPRMRCFSTQILRIRLGRPSNPTTRSSRD